MMGKERNWEISGKILVDVKYLLNLKKSFTKMTKNVNFADLKRHRKYAVIFGCGVNLVHDLICFEV